MLKIYVIHAKKYTDHERHINGMMSRFGLPFEYILDGDADELDEGFLAKNFTERMRRSDRRILSCSTKHLLAMQRLLDTEEESALIFEDDVILKKNFLKVYGEVAEEVKQYAGQPVLISFEDTRLRFVEHSRRVKGQHLYKGDRDRFAACYYVNRLGAQAILDNVPLDEPIDLYHKRLLKGDKLLYLWCHPTIATQGSFNGLFNSSLTPSRRKLKAFEWQLKRLYRLLLYRLR